MKTLKKMLVCLTVIGLFYSCKQQGTQTYMDSTNVIETFTSNDYELYELPKEFLEDSSKIKVLLPVYRSCTVNEPRKLSTLNSGSKKFVHIVDKNNQATASIFGLGNVSLSNREKIAIVDFVQYKDTICTLGTGAQTGMTTRLASGVRLFLKIKNANKKVSLNIPSKVAAAAEFGLAEATFEIETIGFANDQTKEILSDLGDNFNVESYVKIMGAVGNIMKVMKDSLIVNPAQIPILNK